MVSYEDLTDQQHAAVDALDRNVVLSAGAGSDKTTTLTTRYLEMIGRSIDDAVDDETADDADNADDDETADDADNADDDETADDDDETAEPLSPRNVLTTTFTERAANELEASVQTAIIEQFADVDQSAFEAWRTVADDLEDGYIHTLYGFCARLLREYGLTTDAVSPGFETLDETEATALINETVEFVLAEHEQSPAVETLAQQFSRPRLHDVVTDLLAERPESTAWARRLADSTRDAYIDFVETKLHPIDPEEAAALLADPAFVESVETLREIVEDPPDISTGGAAWNRVVDLVDLLESSYDDGVASRSKQTTLAEIGVLLTKRGNDERYRSYTGAKTNWDGHPAKAAFDAAIERIVSTVEPERFAVNVDLGVERRSYPLVQALAKVTRLAADKYGERKHDRNVVDFTDLVTNAVELLDAEVRRELREQFEYVMVDESQDTDPRQWDLVELLTTTDGERFDAENVFVVGDVKQSIYRFRNADVTQFTEISETIGTSVGGDQLTTNFRTLPTVLETINELFESVFEVDGLAYEARPQSLEPARSDPANVGSVEYLLTPTNETYRASRFDGEAFGTAEPSDDAELEATALAAKLS